MSRSRPTERLRSMVGSEPRELTSGWPPAYPPIFGGAASLGGCAPFAEPPAPPEPRAGALPALVLPLGGGETSLGATLGPGWGAVLAAPGVPFALDVLLGFDVLLGLDVL